MVLEKEGYDVTEAPHGAEALSAMQDETPSAAIVDLKMPVMGGLELIDRMRTDARMAGVPVLLLSGFGDAGASSRADAVIAKPFEPQRLLDCLRALVANGA